MTTSGTFGPLLAVALVGIAASASADTIYADSTLDPNLWYPPGAFQQTSSDGAPPPCAFVSGSGDSFFFSLAEYDPASSGPVASVSVSLDARLANQSTGFVFLALEQNGTVYFGDYPPFILNSGLWQPFGRSYTVDQFANAAPDWSASGAPFHLGLLYFAFYLPPGDPLQTSFYMDNVTFTVHAVPEPYPALLLGLARLGLRSRF